jgi:hypothetical protein
MPVSISPFSVVVCEGCEGGGDVFVVSISPAKAGMVSESVKANAIEIRRKLLMMFS